MFSKCPYWQPVKCPIKHINVTNHRYHINNDEWARLLNLKYKKPERKTLRLEFV